MASRGTTAIVLFIIAVISWVAAYFKTQTMSAYIHFVVRALPSYSLIVLGCYMLWEVGFGLARLHDYPKERESLDDDIKRAREFLKKKGVE
mmetsp:Transcript_17764/g.15552  ORF Transcript_17764/g.15552 Transcript_17764/m.15552 type:complete len:91 (+) Transcript_17764:57-329(+)